MLIDRSKAKNHPRLSLDLRCGNCIHFKRVPYFEDKCQNLGVEAATRACRAFHPEVHRLNSVSEDFLATLGVQCKDLKKGQLQVLSYLFKNMQQLEKVGLRFGQPVFLNMSAPRKEYLDCWFRAYVIGVDPLNDGTGYTRIWLSGSMDKPAITTRGVTKISKSKKTILLSQYRNSILTKSEFEEHANTLIEEGRTRLPPAERPARFRTRRALPKDLDDASGLSKEDVPTIDNAPKEWTEKSGDQKRKRKRKLKVKRDKDGDVTRVEILSRKKR